MDSEEENNPDHTAENSGAKGGELTGASAAMDANAETTSKDAAQETEVTGREGTAGLGGGDGISKGGSGGPGGGSHGDDGRTGEHRVRNLTGKGLAFARDCKQKEFSKSVVQWRAVVSAAEKAVADAHDVTFLIGERDKLEASMAEVSDTFNALKPLSDSEELKVYDGKFERCSNHTLDLLRALTDAIRTIKQEVTSQGSKSSHRSGRSRSSRGSQKSTASSTSSQRAAAAAEVAALKAKLKFADTEARQRAELEKTQTEMMLEMASAKLKALDEALSTEHSYSRNQCEPQAELNPKADTFVPQASTASSHTGTETAKDYHDHEALSKALVEQLRITRLPAPEPGVFHGDPLNYPGWRAAFEILIGNRGIPGAERVHYLRRYLAGSAREAVEGFLLISSEDSYDCAMKLLERRFGNPFTIASAFREKLSAWPRVGNRDGPGLRKFSDYLQQCAVAMNKNGSLKALDDEFQNKELLTKLPDWLVNRWARVVARTKEAQSRFPTFAEFASFVEQEAEIACDPITSAPMPKSTPGGAERRNNKVEKRSAGSLNTQSNEKSVEYCYCCEVDGHSLDKCRRFRKKELTEVKSLILKSRLCFGCLGQGHLSSRCRNRATCDECGKRHPTCLHGDVKPSNDAKGEKPTGDTSTKTATSHRSINVRNSPEAGETSKCSMIIPVLVSHEDAPGKEIRVYALLDTQSDTTFVSKHVCDSLNVHGAQVKLLLSTMTSDRKAVSCDRIQGLLVRGVDSNVHIPLPATYTRERIPVDRSHIPGPETARSWPHLGHIADELPPVSDYPIGLLIGYNCPKALVPREVIPHDGLGPYAQRTDLGWGIVGLIHTEEDDDPIGHSHRVLTQVVDALNTRPTGSVVMRTSIKEVVVDPTAQPPMADVLRMLQLDFNEDESSGNQKMSQEDIRFLDIMKGGIHVTDSGHYEMPLPLKRDGIDLPNNRRSAEKRLQQLHRKLTHNKALHKDYTDFMDKMTSCGHAEEVPDNSLDREDGRVWYVPHHGVRNPRKPDKLRVVFDCSARYRDISLNDALLQGPDMINTLVGILVRFRQEPVALVCDVEAMFYQFAVQQEFRDFLRFLWWKGGDLNANPTEYRMTVHLFGASSSPACATYGLRQIALDHKSECDDDVTRFLTRDFYVDDGVRSTVDATSAIRLAKGGVELCKRGGLRLHKFHSNNREVLQSIPPEDRAENVRGIDLLSNKLPSERVLGVFWDAEVDTLGFEVTVSNDKPATRRGILSTVSAIYDPLGIAAPVILGGKQILQELTRSCSSWDDPLPEEMLSHWQMWQSEVENLANLKVARCYKPVDFGVPRRVELHHFADASLKGYGSCSYLRLVNENNEVHCSLVMAKARVTPVKVMTVPRLELTAAVVAVKISQFLDRELDFEDLHHYFWTDSQVVLGYIANEASRFHIFVANRVQFIRTFTSPSQWSHVRTEENPADLVSRGCTVPELLANPIWFRGPSFLWEPQVQDTGTHHDISQDDPEVRKHCLTTMGTVTHSQVLTQIERFSSWTKMCRVVALCMNIKKCIAGTLKPHQLQLSDLQTAQTVIIRLVQEACFSDDIDHLQKHGRTAKGSSILKLDPFVDRTGTLRVGGRLQHGRLPFKEKHPALLPKDHPVTYAIMRHFHKHSAHQGRGMTTHALRSAGFWVIGMSRSVASIIAKCVKCRRLRGEACEQKMADLPPDRLEPAPPFTNCAVDLFRPFVIKEGRRDLKRWGVMFTCLASRAVHLEVATALSTDSYLNALRRFIGLRGAVRLMRSDRGTNFIGAARELAEAISEIDEERVRQYMTDHGCEFRFNSPHASHMGGAWERQIRTARSILQALLDQHGQQLDDDSLRTLLIESAAIMNSRPLTTESLNDPTSLSPLSPNQLLTMKTSVVLPPPGKFQQADMYSRKRWRRVQHLANVFWARWKREFLLQLQQRQKWHVPRRNLTVGDIVLLKDETPRCQWRLGRVTETLPSKDGQIRRVKVVVSTQENGKNKPTLSTLERPVQKLVLLVEATR